MTGVSLRSITIPPLSNTPTGSVKVAPGVSCMASTYGQSFRLGHLGWDLLWLLGAKVCLVKPAGGRDPKAQETNETNSPRPAPSGAGREGGFSTVSRPKQERFCLSVPGIDTSRGPAGPE